MGKYMQINNMNIKVYLFKGYFHRLLGFRIAQLDTKPEEWCLLGCYAVWLL
jgi:hypothetical protein